MADPRATQSAHEAEQRFWAEVEACAQVEGEERATREAALWQHWGAERAVLFTDLSGFSRAVAEHGIVYFLELVRRKRALLGAVLAQHRATLEQQLRAAFRGEANETSLAGWTPLGNYELQRKRDRLPLAALLKG